MLGHSCIVTARPRRFNCRPLLSARARDEARASASSAARDRGADPFLTVNEPSPLRLIGNLVIQIREIRTKTLPSGGRLTVRRKMTVLSSSMSSVQMNFAPPQNGTW